MASCWRGLPVVVGLCVCVRGGSYLQLVGFGVIKGGGRGGGREGGSADEKFISRDEDESKVLMLKLAPPFQARGVIC